MFCFALQRFYILGTNSDKTLWRLLKIDRSEPSELVIDECSTVYTESDCHDLLKDLDEDRRSTGGVKFVTKFYGIIGKFSLFLLQTVKQIICMHTLMINFATRFHQVPWAILHANHY